MTITKKRYTQGFFAATAFLALVRCAFPGVAESGTAAQAEARADSTAPAGTACGKDMTCGTPSPAADRNSIQPATPAAAFFAADGRPHKNRIYSVSSFKACFPDSNSAQMADARRYGVTPVKDRTEAEQRMKELVYMGSNPYYHVDRLNSSIPYLVPRAAVLLQDIGRAYFDSLQIKGIPLHKIIVTSVLRTRDDVTRLRNRNGNATENSCHLYGTTFDICYNRYKTVEDPGGPARRAVRNDTLKWVLSEVLRDFREQGRCHIKYEVKQGCFHMTVK